MSVEYLNYICDAINNLKKTSLIDIISIIISTASFITAILIPIRIANRQNKTALFEKRLNSYSELNKLSKFCDMIRDCRCDNKTTTTYAGIINYRKGIVDCFCQAFNCSVFTTDSNLILKNHIYPTIEKNRLYVNYIPLLYGKKLSNKCESITNDLNNIYDYLQKFINETFENSNPQNDQSYKEELITCTAKFINEYSDMLKKSLTM